MYSPPIGGPHGLTLTSIREEEDAEPGTVQLRQNYPNPFNGSTIIPVDIPVPSVIEAVVFASTGQRVRTLSKRSYPQGSALLVWDGTDDSGKSVASGIYICRLLTTHPSGDRREKESGRIVQILERKVGFTDNMHSRPGRCKWEERGGTKKIPSVLSYGRDQK